METNIGLYSVFSKERFKITPDGLGSYTIVEWGHLSSYLLGYTGGISWEENESFIYPGVYHAYVSLKGVLNVWGFTFEKQNTRYINVGLLYNTYGQSY